MVLQMSEYDGLDVFAYFFLLLVETQVLGLQEVAEGQHMPSPARDNGASTLTHGSEVGNKSNTSYIVYPVRA